ncbi:MAG: Fic family protein [Bacteriovoracaceae bacterium]|nr:Fic family protein [Bacteriovoracaceae bacterium]
MANLFDYNEKIISLLQLISQMEGELQGLTRSFSDEDNISSQAAIEAVHYSTKIEGNPLTLKQVTSALLENNVKNRNKRSVREIINYSKARSRIIEKSKTEQILSNKFILELHNILLIGIVRGNLKGHYRAAQNVIKDSKTNEIVYLPPEWRDVKKLMKELISWTNSSLLNNVSPLIVSAIFHYQFVTIHPFMDGNGRLARLLSNYIILSNGYNVISYSALEKQHELRRNRYYSSLRKVQAETFYEIDIDNNLTSWLEYWLNCLSNTYKEAISKVRLLHKTEGGDLPERLKLAIGFFKKHNKLRAIEYESIMGVARTQAVSDLKKLVELGYIKKIGGGRSTVYQKL